MGRKDCDVKLPAVVFGIAYARHLHTHGQLPDWAGRVLENSQAMVTRLVAREFLFLVHILQADLISL
jgi:hypothetical protein